MTQARTPDATFISAWREHGMASALNGMALSQTLIPYGATFLQFYDYCKPAVRLAAFMGVQSIFVFTHDSIGLGEDGPTHQPMSSSQICAPFTVLSPFVQRMPPKPPQPGSWPLNAVTARPC